MASSQFQLFPQQKVAKLLTKYEVAAKSPTVHQKSQLQNNRKKKNPPLTPMKSHRELRRCVSEKTQATKKYIDHPSVTLGLCPVYAAQKAYEGTNNAPHSFHQSTQRTSCFERYVLGVDCARRVAPYPLLYSRVLVPVVVKLKRSASSKGIRSFLSNQSPGY